MSDVPEAGSKFRSPPFPFVPLQKAVERAEQLYAAERDNAAPLVSTAKAWGYKPTSSGGIQTVAALKQFGLLSDEGSGAARKVRLTKTALRVILDKRPGSPDRQKALQEAALAPKIHRELFDEYGPELPSPSTVKTYLTLDRKLADQAPFSDQSADELIREYTATIAFAGLTGSVSMSPSEEDLAPDEPPTPLGGNGSQPHGPSGADGAKDGEQRREVALTEGERIVFVEEGSPHRYFKLVASGDADELMLDALVDYANRQKRRLAMAAKASPSQPQQRAASEAE